MKYKTAAQITQYPTGLLAYRKAAPANTERRTAAWHLDWCSELDVQAEWKGSQLTARTRLNQTQAVGADPQPQKGLKGTQSAAAHTGHATAPGITLNTVHITKHQESKPKEVQPVHHAENTHPGT